MIETRNLVHRYDGVPVVDGVSLTVDDGEFVVVAGPNGAGKTTLVHHFNGLKTPDEGIVLVDGHDVEDTPVVARTRVGMVFQEPADQFVAGTVDADIAFGPENLGLSRPEIDQRVEAALETVGMADRAGARISSLSGGEKQRVAIAGVLAMEPSHLVLDEPLTGLDERARRSVLDRVRELSADGMSFVVVSHDLRDLLPLTDRVVVVEDGTVALDAPPQKAAERLPEFGVRVPC